MKNIIFILFLGLSFSFTKQPNPKTQTVIIKTSAECGECKERIESKLNYTKGIVFSELDFVSKELTVKFKSAKISLQEIKQIVADLGYDADELKANPEEYQKLPACCKVGGMEHEEH